MMRNLRAEPLVRSLCVSDMARNWEFAVYSFHYHPGSERVLDIYVTFLMLKKLKTFKLPITNTLLRAKSPLNDRRSFIGLPRSPIQLFLTAHSSATPPKCRFNLSDCKISQFNTFFKAITLYQYF